jgi:putative colanic acid biosynthesis glycosyltransferase
MHTGPDACTYLSGGISKSARTCGCPSAIESGCLPPQLRRVEAMAKISIITVCRNDLKGLETTFESIKIQNCDDFEWWVVDGGSADGTVEWLGENHRLRGSWISEPDNGIYDAMNKGIGLAAGDYLLFMNSGDMFADPDVISKLVHTIEQEKTAPDFVYGDALDIAECGESYYRKALHISYIKLGMITRHQSMLYRRELVASERYPSSFKLSGDYALTASTLMRKGAKILQVKFPICRFAMGGTHDEHRLKALREDFRIRNEILEENYLACLLLFSVHWLHHYIRKLFPNMNKRFIYKNP